MNQKDLNVLNNIGFLDLNSKMKKGQGEENLHLSAEDV